VLLLLASAGCSEKQPMAITDAAVAKHEAAPLPAPSVEVPTAPLPPALLQPVDFWDAGRRVGQVDAQGIEQHEYLFLDLGEGWTPILFSDGKNWKGEPTPHKFRDTYLALARGEFPKDAYGQRAQEDKYLELYGIMPTLAVVRARMTWARELACAKDLDLSSLASFDGVITYQGPDESRRAQKKFLAAQQVVHARMAEQKVDDPALVAADRLDDKQRAQLALYLAQRDDDQAIRAAQARLACEGYLDKKGKWEPGAFDWPTHEALAEFERRHRVYSWGALGPATVAALRMDTAQAEHETVLRVLEERAMHAFGAIEDGSAKNDDGSPVTFIGADGNRHPVRDLRSELRAAVVQAFGLHDPESTHAFLTSLGELERDGHHYVALRAPEKPEYHSTDMDLTVTIDRGDVWYEFPFDESGKERSLPVTRRPHHNIVVEYMGQQIPIASYGTTIGGWKSELINGSVWWKYKESPAGEVLWKDIVSAPVWLPPSSTPPRDLLKRRRKPKPGESKWEPNYHETGPSYASAYGLVAAYHRPFERTAEGGIRITGDDGIRSHGSVDYMSIMRRTSHGCHRLHNHIAVRLFSFVLNHRPHIRTGHQATEFVLDLEYEKEPHRIEINQGGYVFRLNKPIFVRVEEGRIKGDVQDPILTAIPKFNTACKAYYLPDGGTVIPSADGTLVASTPPANCDAGLPVLPPLPQAVPTLGSMPDWDPALVNTQPAAATRASENLGVSSP
jgi:hypothetical protein